MVKVLNGIMPPAEAIEKEEKRVEDYVKSQIGEVSPFFLAMVDQFEELLLGKYDEFRKAFVDWENNDNKESFFSLYEKADQLTMATSIFIELLNKDISEDEMDVKQKKRLEIIYNNSAEKVDYKSIESGTSFLKDSLKVLNDLFCEETFDELKTLDKSWHWTYSNYFFAEYFQIFDPIKWIKRAKEL